MSQEHAKIWLRPWSSGARLMAAALVGAVVELGLRQIWSASLSAILAWDASVICFLGLTYQVIADRSIDSIRRRAARLDTATWVLMLLVVVAACVSLFGLVLGFQAPMAHCRTTRRCACCSAGFTVLGPGH